MITPNPSFRAPSIIKCRNKLELLPYLRSFILIALVTSGSINHVPGSPKSVSGGMSEIHGWHPQVIPLRFGSHPPLAGGVKCQRHIGHPMSASWWLIKCQRHGGWLSVSVIAADSMSASWRLIKCQSHRGWSSVSVKAADQMSASWRLIIKSGGWSERHFLIYVQETASRIIKLNIRVLILIQQWMSTKMSTKRMSAKSTHPNTAMVE